MSEEQAYADHLREWHRWRWRAVAAFVALALANAFGFWLIGHERKDRITTAATVFELRCLDARANRAALRRALEGMGRIIRIRVAAGSRGRDESVRVLAELDRQLDLLPPIQDCRAQAETIRRLAD